MCDDLGSFIHQKRVEKKITMRKLAGMLDVPVTYLCDVEKNRCRIKDRLALLAEILALSDEEKIRMFELAENASVDTDLSGYEMPACSLIEDPENGEKEWLQMVAELESRKIRFLHITEKVERRFFMKKKIMMVVLAGVLVGSMESAMVYAGRMPELTKTESNNKSSIWEDYLKEHSERGVKEQFIKEHVGDLSDEQLDHMIGAYFGDDESLDNEDSCNDGYQDSDVFPVSLYSYTFQEEIGGNDYDFVQYTAVVNQGSGSVQVLLPKGCKFVTGYGKLTDGYRAYDSLDEAVQKGEDICLSEGLSENLPDSNVICWDAKGDGTYTFAVEKTGDAEDDAIWLVDGYGYTGSEDLTGKVTEPDEDLDSDMLVGGALSEESYHGTLDGDLFFLLRRK